MTQRTVAVELKIPDNQAYTALTALQRLGLDVERVERSEIWHVDDQGEAATLAARVEANASIFNPNKHRLSVLDGNKPRAGETWIDEAGEHDDVREHLGGSPVAGVARVSRSVGWRLYGRRGVPVSAEILVRAVDALLCNPAIEKARYE